MRDEVDAGRGDGAGSPRPPNARDARLTLDADASSVSTARRFLRRTLEAWGSSSMTDTATLLASELVTNAILHARCAPDVVIRLDGPRLRVEVHDTSHVAPARKQYGLYAATGRGIGLVDELSADWGVTPQAGGKSVWFELDEDAPTKGARLLDADTMVDLAELAGLGPPPARPGRGTAQAGPVMGAAA